MNRPIEPDMLLLWARIETVCAAVDQIIRSLVGEGRGFTLMVHPETHACATLSVTNRTENVEAIREWLRNMDLKTEGVTGRNGDGLMSVTYGDRSKYLEVCKANLAEHESDSFAAYVQRMPAGLPLLSESEWDALHAEHLERLRENIRVNRIRKRRE